MGEEGVPAWFSVGSMVGLKRRRDDTELMMQQVPLPTGIFNQDASAGITSGNHARHFEFGQKEPHAETPLTQMQQVSCPTAIFNQYASTGLTSGDYAKFLVYGQREPHAETPLMQMQQVSHQSGLFHQDASAGLTSRDYARYFEFGQKVPCVAMSIAGLNNLKETAFSGGKKATVSRWVAVSDEVQVLEFNEKDTDPQVGTLTTGQNDPKPFTGDEKASASTFNMPAAMMKPSPCAHWFAVSDEVEVLEFNDKALQVGTLTIRLKDSKGGPFAGNENAAGSAFHFTGDETEVMNSSALNMQAVMNSSVAPQVALPSDVQVLESSQNDPVRKSLPENIEFQPTDAGLTRKYHGPLFDFPFFADDTVESGPKGHNGIQLTLGYTIKDLISQEDLDMAVRNKREKNLKKIGELLALNAEKKMLRPDTILKLKISEKSLRLADLQARLRKEIEKVQEEIMEMPDEEYQEFVRDCDRQRREDAMELQARLKAKREKGKAVTDINQNDSMGHSGYSPSNSRSECSPSNW